MPLPDLKDYLALFTLYQEDLGTAYLGPPDDRYRLLFDQVCRLLVQPSPFNLRLPDPFRQTAHRYLAGDPDTVAHMTNPENRNFMLSDLFDFIELQRLMGAR